MKKGKRQSGGFHAEDVFYGVEEFHAEGAEVQRAQRVVCILFWEGFTQRMQMCRDVVWRFSMKGSQDTELQ